MDWISVNDGLPIDNMDCLVIVRYKDVPKKDTCPFILTRRYSLKKGWRYQNKKVEYWIAIPPAPSDLINGEYCRVN